MSNHGTVKLRSGRWDWSVRPQQSGAAVVYKHRNRSEDELRTWSSDPEVTASRAADLAIEPVERRWADPDGLVWRLQVEYPSNWVSETRAADDGSMRLVFNYGGIRRSSWIPADVRVGELTHMELIELLREAR